MTEQTESKRYRGGNTYTLLSDESLKRPITIEELKHILSSTVKRDEPTKTILFLAMLDTFTEENQQNIALSSETTTGKSYIPLEIVSYFPPSLVQVIGGASPTAFFHEVGKWDEERKSVIVDLEQKILIFLDQPHWMLLQKLRPMLSHDRKEIQYKITGKTLKTKNIILRGFPTVIFCTTRSNPDEQEKSRFMFLSPSVEEEKIVEAIYLVGEKEGDTDTFRKKLKENKDRNWLKQRVLLIYKQNIRDVVIEDWRKVCKLFLEEHENPIPRHMRDFPRLMGLIKSHALLNCFSRKKLPDGRILATKEDIKAGFELYNEVGKPNELGLSPECYRIYITVIEPLLSEEAGVDRQTVRNKYYTLYHRQLSNRKLRREILPALESARLISQEKDSEDRRRKLIFPADGGKGSVPAPISERLADYFE